MSEPITTDDLSCQELVELVTDYLEGALPDGERVRFDEHLAVCEGCRVYVDQMRRTIRTVGALREDAIAPEARETLLAAFRNWRRR
jgi:predicted anti-sigma-YlaC factor YlaD